MSPACPTNSFSVRVMRREDDGQSSPVTQQEQTYMATSPVCHHGAAKEQDVGPENPKLQLKRHADHLWLPAQGSVQRSDKRKPRSWQSCVACLWCGRTNTWLLCPLWSVV